MRFQVGWSKKIDLRDGAGDVQPRLHKAGSDFGLVTTNLEVKAIVLLQSPIVSHNTPYCTLHQAVHGGSGHLVFEAATALPCRTSMSKGSKKHVDNVQLSFNLLTTLLCRNSCISTINAPTTQAPPEGRRHQSLEVKV